MFRNAYRLPFRLLGIPLDLDISFLLILPLLAWMIANNIPAFIDAFDLKIDPSVLRESVHPYLLGTTAALGLFASIIIHELGHSVVGRRFGMETISITLWILGGMARFKEISKRPGAEAIMAIAGPLTSYALSGIFWLGLLITPAESSALLFVLSYLMWMNIILATFNLLPAIPLDGGRVLRSLLALRMGHFRATQTSVTVGRYFAIFLGIVGIASFNIFMVLVAFFVLMAGASEEQIATFSSMLRGVKVRDVMTRSVKTVPPDMSVPDLLEKMFREKHLAYPVVDRSGATLGIVTLRDIQPEAVPINGTDPINRTAPQLVSAVMLPSESISPLESSFDAFERISQHASGRLLVIDSAGNLEGIISKSDLVQAVQIRTVGRALTQAS